MDTKTCTKCSTCKPADTFHFQARELKRTSSLCRDCERKRVREFTREKRAKNGREDRAAEYSKRREDRAQDKAAAMKRLALAIRRAGKAKQTKPPATVCWLWNRPGITPGEKWAMRYRLDEEFRLKERLRRQITKKAKNDGIADLMRGALRRRGNSNTVESLLGYSIAKLRRHLERQFTGGMSWENMADWHIDHIAPQASFNLRDPDEWRRCWCISNLRPMWGSENVSKGAKRLFLL